MWSELRGTRRQPGGGLPMRAWAVATAACMAVTSVGVRDIALRVTDPLHIDGRMTEDVTSPIVLARRERPAVVDVPTTGSAPGVLPASLSGGTQPFEVVAPGPRTTVVDGPWEFEDDLEGWQVEQDQPGLPATTWTWVGGPHEGRSGTARLVLEAAGQYGYGDDADVSLVSPWLDDPRGAQRWVDVDLRSDIEGDEYDWILVEWQQDRFEPGPWRPLHSLGDTPRIPGYWEPVVAGFSPADEYRVRIRLVSDVANSTATPVDRLYEGVAIDRVAIHDVDPSVPVEVPDLPTVSHEPTSEVVVALAGTISVNPYHEEFRDTSARAWQHPSTYLPGYPEDALALHLTFDAPTLEEAIAADVPVWRRVEPDRLYWVPGTRLVGLWAAGDLTPQGACEPWCNLQPQPGTTRRELSHHSMGQASRVAGRQTGACPDCLLVVSSGLSGGAVSWLEEHTSWIDVVTPLSMGLIADDSPAQDLDRGWIASMAQLAEERLVVLPDRDPGLATTQRDEVGNLDTPIGVPGPLTALGMLPGAVLVGGHDSGHVVPGNNSPHVVADVCGTTVASTYGLSGTQQSIPGITVNASSWAAGHAARLLLEARRHLGDVGDPDRPDGVLALGHPVGEQGPLADGALDRDELRDLVLRTATPRPDGQASDGPRCTDVKPGLRSLDLQWREVPDDVPAFPNIGYGAVDDVALGRALDILRGDERMPVRRVEDAWFVVQDLLREEAHRLSWWRELDPPVAG